MSVCEDGIDITEILTGHVMPDVPFDWLVGNMSACQENLFRSRCK